MGGFSLLGFSLANGRLTVVLDIIPHCGNAYTSRKNKNLTTKMPLIEHASGHGSYRSIGSFSSVFPCG